ncbi:hypothetical protein OBBRIDRAFT_840343 [Obba rivulosa]|uniref:DRBM domain-containing protein n=1 Tax=Obba rivulosa TaxID=1052685 RepID=A0A8E2AN22_9APHY|nr:hypothetical protein OBBRIDRAFT_840343 [Obba rivulosa]
MPVWQCEAVGSERNMIWIAVVLLGGVEHGRGYARRKGAAKEQAAEMAYWYLV